MIGALFLSLAGLLCLLFAIAAWSGASGREARLPVHVAAWVGFVASFLAIDRLTQPPLAQPPALLPPWTAALLLASLSLLLGLVLARVRPTPLAFRRLLAPYDGFSLWVHWLLGLARTQRRRSEARSANAEAEATASPRGGTGPGSVHEGVRDLASLTVGEIMIPRSEVVALEGNASVARSIGTARQSPHSVFPIYGESVDQPLGVVRMIDLSSKQDAERPVRELARPVPIVPETMRCLALLPRLAPADHTAALVVDEFGSMAGFLTVEDLIEVLVGDFVGEHEIERRRITPISPGIHRVEGSCRIEEFNLAIAPLLPEGEYETVAGLFLDRFGRVPEVGDEVELPGVRLEVSAATDRRVLWLVVELRGGREKEGRKRT